MKSRRPDPLRVGVLGCGKIAGAYGTSLRHLPSVRLVACADLNRSRAEEMAHQAGLRVTTPAELLRDPAVDAVLNLTVPAVHAKTTLAALSAGKHVYVEKPLAITLAEGKKILSLAKKVKRRVGCAPDTILGPGHQTALRMIHEGRIGKPFAASAFMQCPGHEHWHPDPDFYYRKGGGPLFDMGPYYLTALVQALGPVQKVAGMASVGRNPRIITSQPRNGKEIKVETSTHVAALLEFRSTAVAQIGMSFDVAAHTQPWLEIHGTQGSMQFPDPNRFTGPVRFHALYGTSWEETHPEHPENIQRGMGLAEMAEAIAARRPHQASLELAFHVLEIMTAVLDSARTGRRVTVRSIPTAWEPLPEGIPAMRIS
ncbi:MAG: gfo/Idh/MocA family oxidoreductase [Verrucomicrobia bacterium]|nr:gfo/Idh/MocA family oxidoreductase [Verrucomicrobiota bacterium]